MHACLLPELLTMTTLSFLRLRWLGGKKVWASDTLATCVWAGQPPYRPVATRASHSIRAPSRPPAATQTGMEESEKQLSFRPSCWVAQICM